MNSTVLVVDDKTDMRQSFKVMLNRQGYQVRLARSGREAIKLQREIKADSIVVDMQMPNLDGPQTIDQIREFDQNVQFVSVSGYWDDYKTRAEGKVFGSIDKPVTKKKKGQLAKLVADASDETRRKRQSIYSNLASNQESDRHLTHSVKKLFIDWVKSNFSAIDGVLMLGSDAMSVEQVVKEINDGGYIGNVLFESFIQEMRSMLDLSNIKSP